ncbi:MAG: hypothetical protein ACP5I4_16240 [Oceanipulchritudo sp.]|jgi:hypothetical protein
MNSQCIGLAILIPCGICLLLAGLTGCATSGGGIPPDRQAIAELGKIAVLTKRLEPQYERLDRPLNDGEAIVNAKPANLPADNRHRQIQMIRESGVYDVFAHELARKFACATDAEVRLLDKAGYIHEGSGGDRRLDALSSAMAQGFDAVLVASVTPSLYEKQEEGNRYSRTGRMNVRLILQQVPDGTILWDLTYSVGGLKYSSTGGDQFPAWYQLARDSADRAMEWYAASRP